jgi:hypothetical protein
MESQDDRYGNPESDQGRYALSDRIALTCAHVVNLALQRNELALTAPAAGTILTLSFPMLGNGELRQARILDWSSPGYDGLDCVVLELVEAAPSEAGQTILAIVPSEDIEDSHLLIYASRSQKHPGALLAARMLGEVGGRWAQLDMSGRSGVQPGYSGCAVWSREQRATVGMMVARGSETDGFTGYFLPAVRIADRFGKHFPKETRRLPLRRQISFTLVSVLLFGLMLFHFMAHTGSATTGLVPWAGGSKALAAFFGAHCFAIILGPYVMWHALMHARSFASRPWWQRVPSPFGNRSAANLNNTRLGASMVMLFLLLLPAAAQGVFLDQVFIDDGRRIVANTLEFSGISEDDAPWCAPLEGKWCQADGVGIWSFRLDGPYFDHAYQIVGECDTSGQCSMVTFFPLLHPTILFGGTLLAYGFLLLFVFALVFPWPFALTATQKNGGH